MKKRQKNSVRAFALRVTVSAALVSVSAILLAWSFGPVGRASADQAAAGVSVEARTVALPKVAPVVFRGDVRDLPQVPQREITRPELKEPISNKYLLAEALKPTPEQPNIPLAPMPAPIQNFPGITRTDICTGGQCGAGTPPDTNGEVGRNHYIQAVNSAYAIYGKTGTLLASFTENALWAGTGTFCDGHGGGDPVVIYDAVADRWILTHLAYSGSATSGPFDECIAVSRTNDPVSGGWYLYDIRTDTGAVGQPPINTLNDYPKFGIWTDCLYYSANGFLMPAGIFNGAEFASFSRSDMYAGLPLTGALGFIANNQDPFTMIPSHLAAPGTAGLPSAGTPNYYVSESTTAFAFEVRKFTAGPNCGGGGTLSAAINVTQTSYNGSGTGVPQPNTTVTLDTLFDRLMQKVQYRKVGSAESLWVVHDSQNSGATNRPQWAQLNVTGGTISTTPVQQQIYAPDTTIHRWMGSIAADKDGNVAVGYSTSNGTSPNFPSIKYSGRLATDPLNSLPQTETQLVAGSGSQTGTCGGSPCTRWGDYASMSVDPVDGCTFWYTSEYYTSQTNGSTSPPIWSTRIGAFAFPSCVPFPTPTPTPTATPTPTPNPTPSPSPTPTPNPTATPTPSPSQTATPTPTPTPTPAPTATPSPSPSPTPAPAPTPSPTPTATPSPTPTPAPVTVSVTVSPTQIREGSRATYTVSASAAVAQATTVNYAMSGTATQGADYVLSGTAGQATIPAGQSSAPVTARAKKDHVTEGTETATMTLQAGTGYTVGQPSQATLSITDQ